ncbi:MAG: hypothetical protein AB1297_02245 [bacterium]
MNIKVEKINETITLERLERDLEGLKKRLFIYETLQSEKEIREKKLKGPFSLAKQLLENIRD